MTLEEAHDRIKSEWSWGHQDLTRMSDWPEIERTLTEHDPGLLDIFNTWRRSYQLLDRLIKSLDV